EKKVEEEGEEKKVEEEKEAHPPPAKRSKASTAGSRQSREESDEEMEESSVSVVKQESEAGEADAKRTPSTLLTEIENDEKFEGLNQKVKDWMLTATRQWTATLHHVRYEIMARGIASLMLRYALEQYLGWTHGQALKKVEADLTEMLGAAAAQQVKEVSKRAQRLYDDLLDGKKTMEAFEEAFDFFMDALRDSVEVQGEKGTLFKSVIELVRHMSAAVDHLKATHPNVADRCEIYRKCLVEGWSATKFDASYNPEAAQKAEAAKKAKEPQAAKKRGEEEKEEEEEEEEPQAQPPPKSKSAFSFYAQSAQQEYEKEHPEAGASQ
ncbi:MAG: hypothetical protein P4L67_02275, partial [Candidatus Pacebacteria bacterium]|nr:hypothetical protein [Candidatus Paceibacterota bacterium]